MIKIFNGQYFEKWEICSFGLHAGETYLDRCLTFIDILFPDLYKGALCLMGIFVPPFTVKLIHSYLAKKVVVYIHKMLGIGWITAMVEIQISWR